MGPVIQCSTSNAQAENHSATESLYQAQLRDLPSALQAATSKSASALELASATQLSLESLSRHQSDLLAKYDALHSQQQNAADLKEASDGGGAADKGLSELTAQLQRHETSTQQQLAALDALIKGLLTQRKLPQANTDQAAVDMALAAQSPVQLQRDDAASLATTAQCAVSSLPAHAPPPQLLTTGYSVDGADTESADGGLKAWLMAQLSKQEKQHADLRDSLIPRLDGIEHQSARLFQRSVVKDVGKLGEASSFSGALRALEAATQQQLDAHTEALRELSNELRGREAEVAGRVEALDGLIQGILMREQQATVSEEAGARRGDAAAASLQALEAMVQEAKALLLLQEGERRTPPLIFTVGSPSDQASTLRPSSPDDGSSIAATSAGAMEAGLRAWVEEQLVHHNHMHMAFHSTLAAGFELRITHILSSMHQV